MSSSRFAVPLVVLPALVAGALIAGCGSTEEAAVLAFSETYSCPRERVVVTPVRGITAFELWQRVNPMPEPPAEVRADPARLAVARQAWEEQHEGVERGLNRTDLFHVSGCEHAVDLGCACVSGAGSTTGGVDTAQGRCVCVDPPAPIPPELR